MGIPDFFECWHSLSNFLISSIGRSVVLVAVFLNVDEITIILPLITALAPSQSVAKETLPSSLNV